MPHNLVNRTLFLSDLNLYRSLAKWTININLYYSFIYGVTTLYTRTYSTTAAAAAAAEVAETKKKQINSHYTSLDTFSPLLLHPPKLTFIYTHLPTLNLIILFATVSFATSCLSLPGVCYCDVIICFTWCFKEFNSSNFENPSRVVVSFGFCSAVNLLMIILCVRVCVRGYKL